MAKESSVAPKERVNIVYKPATGDAKEEKELPLKLLMLGDYTLREEETLLEDRKPISVDKDNFDDVDSIIKILTKFSILCQFSEILIRRGNDSYVCLFRLSSTKWFITLFL